MKKLLLLTIVLIAALSLTACEVYFGDGNGGGASSNNETASPASGTQTGAAAGPSSTAAPSSAQDPAASSPDQGGAAFKTDKAQYAANEIISISVSGITQAMVNGMAWIGIFREGASHDEYFDYIYIEAGSSIAEMYAPGESGNYELRLFKKDPPEMSDFMMAVSFTVE